MRPVPLWTGADPFLTESAGSRMLVNEHMYQALVLGIVLSASDRFDAKADMEGGDRSCDLRMVRRKGDGPSIVVEFKKLGSKASETSLEEACSRALEQISDREYAHGIADPVTAFGIAFSGKRAKAMSDMLPNRASLHCSWTIRTLSIPKSRIIRRVAEGL